MRSGPHQTRIGKAQLRQMLTDVRSDCGQRSGVPNGVWLQSKRRMSAPISPPPDRKDGSLSSRAELTPLSPLMWSRTASLLPRDIRLARLVTANDRLDPFSHLLTGSHSSPIGRPRQVANQDQTHRERV